jgi:Tfp pilus assembly protein PilO
MAKLSENKKLLVIAGVTVLLTGGAVAGVWWAKGVAEERRQEIVRMNQEIAECNTKISKIPELEKDVIVLRECVHEYVKILPEATEFTTFTRQVSTFITQSGVEFKSQTNSQNSGSKGPKFDRWTYQIIAKGTIWQFMKFVNLFENYERFVNVKSWSLTSGAGNTSNLAQAGTADVVHSFSLVLETYVYTGARGKNDVQIPGYANRKASLRDEINKQIGVVKLDQYQFKDARGRRDIFVDPREIPGPDQVTSQPLATQKKIIDDFTLEITQLRGMFARTRESGITIIERMDLDRRLKQGLDLLQARIDDVNAKAQISYIPYKLKWTREVVEAVEGLRGDLNRVADQGRDRNLTEAELRDLFAAMKEDLTNGSPESAKTRFDSAQDRLEVLPQDPRYRTVMSVRRLNAQAGIAIEFSQKKLDIKGVCVLSGGRSGMILNGQVVQEGDYLDDDLLLKSVGREQVEFVYKGFTLVKTW